jgi:sec-independent protein translocase protein TatA
VFGDVGLPELLVIFIIVLIVFGPGKLPDAGRAIGEAIRGLKNALRSSQHSTAGKNDETK